MTDARPSDDHITSIADAVVRLKELRDSQKNLNEPDIEEQFAKLALAFKTDKFTLSKRVELQQHQRDNAERNIERELESLRESLNALNQLCTRSDMREVITKTQQHVDIVQETTKRMSREAETYGAVQQENRMNNAFETTLSYAEHLKMLFDKEHLELEEYRRLLAEHNLLPEDKRTTEDETKRIILPPRSHSLSGSSKPEPRGRLLSAVCLLNASTESNWLHNGNTTSLSPSLSPKIRRSSLPVGPMTTTPQNSLSSNVLAPVANIRTTAALDVFRSTKDDTQRKESLSGVSPPSLESTSVAEKTDEKIFDSPQDESVMSPISEESPDHKECRKLLRRGSSEEKFLPQLLYDVQNNCEADFDSEASGSADGDDIQPTIKTNYLSFLRPLLATSSHCTWHWDTGIFVLRLRYFFSTLLGIAALLSFLLTFLPNSIILSFPSV